MVFFLDAFVVAFIVPPSRVPPRRVHRAASSSAAPRVSRRERPRPDPSPGTFVVSVRSPRGIRVRARRRPSLHRVNFERPDAPIVIIAQSFIVPGTNPRRRTRIHAFPSSHPPTPREHRRPERGDPRDAPPALEVSVDPQRRPSRARSARDAAKAEAVRVPIGFETGRAPNVASVRARGRVHAHARPRIVRARIRRVGVVVVGGGGDLAPPPSSLLVLPCALR